MTRTLDQIAAEAWEAGQFAFEDAETKQPLSARIREAANWPDYGSDGDLSSEQRQRLHALADEATEIEASEAAATGDDD